MKYTFKVPNTMRVFDPLTPGGLVLGNSGDSVQAGERITILQQISVVLYDDRSQLGLLCDTTPPTYLLIAEVTGLRDLVTRWSILVRSHRTDEAAETFKDIQKKLGAHMTQTLAIVAGTDFERASDARRSPASRL